ncbi:MAG: TonB-dependent receptor, partial [Saprospiraceae bacterium]
AIAQRPSRGGGSYGKPAAKIKGYIKGKVVDTQTGQPVEFATIVLENPKDSSQVNGTVTEPDGTFRMNNIDAGAYMVRINFLGYEELAITDVKTTPKNPDLDLKSIQLSPDAVALSEVEVVGEKSVIENRIDKLVYNADQDATNAGGDAADVLRKVPLLSVDLEGNVSLRGSSNLQILINGRPSTIFASSVADALQSIPGDQIKSVEVVTTPSARYDGEGSGGIINIITKKKEAQGFTGTARTSIGTRQNNAGLNINALFGRFGINGGLGSFWSWQRDGDSDFLRQDFDDSGATIRELSQTGINGNRVLGLNGSGGAFYDFNAYNSLNANFRLNQFDRFNEGNTTGVLDATNDPNSEFAEVLNFTRLSDLESSRSGFDGTLDYRKTFPDQKDRELIFAFQISGNESRANNQVEQQGSIERYQEDFINNNDGLNLEYTFQVDYVHPFSDKLKMETGVKSILRRIDSDYQTQQRLSDVGNYEVLPDFTDLFFYDQDIYAGFLSFNVQLAEKWGLVAGSRYEYTDIRGDFESEQPSFQQDYQNLLPSVILNYKLSRFSGLKLSYNQRIQRPSIFFINPFTNIGDPNNISVGNPSLEPERVQQYELAYNTYVKGVVVNAAAYYRDTRDLIERFLTVANDGVASETTFLNIGTSQVYGANLFTSFTIKKILTLRGSFNGGLYNGQGTFQGEPLERTAFNYSGNMSGSLKLGEKFTIEFFGLLNGPRQTLQGTNPSFSLLSMGGNWDVSERTKIGIRAVEPFVGDKVFEGELRGADFFQTSRFSIPFRSIGISLSHKFGQIDFKSQTRRSKVRNQDQKSGGENSSF